VSPSRPSRPRVVVVGVGRLGGALALALGAKRWPVRMLARSEESRRRTLGLGLKLASDKEVAEARVCLLCVPDKAVPAVAEELKPRLARGAALVHCAGALSLEALGAPRGKVLGSFHPLVAVSDPRDSLAGNAVALSTRSRWLREVMERMAKDVGLRALRVPEKHRATYHAGAVLSAGGVVAALSAAVEAFRVAGIPEEDALAALLPLTRSALRGVEARGLAAGYTGPIARGDAGVVAAHLAALPPQAAAVYRPLSRRGLELVRSRLTPEARALLEELL
jgi:predicted short-subunit dehydrogenase-like oxidoreductase (DUF2520 family)